MASFETGRNPEQRSSRAERFLKIATLVAGLFSPAVYARDASGAPREYSDIDQLSGKNFEEREKEIKKLERECEQIKADIKKLEERIENEDSLQYTNSVRVAERMDLRKKQRDLRRKEAAIGRLQKGMDAGHERTEREIKRKEGRRDLADRTGLEILDPTLDLSAEGLGNRAVARYYKDYQIGFADHALMFQLKGVDPYQSRGMLAIGPEFTGAHFFIGKGGSELRVVFDLAHGEHTTLVLYEGDYVSYDPSDAHGNKSPVDSDE